MPAERTTERMRRILVLVPWVMAHPECTVDEVCSRFGMDRDELSRDLDLLMVCGLPPFGPGDLIEAFIDGDRVSIRMADALQRPARLTRSEAIALLVMGRALLALPEVDEAPALRSALDKLGNAVTPDEAARAAELADRIVVELRAAGTDLLAVVRDAAEEHAALRIEYFTESRGEMTERTIEPLVVFSAMGNWYVAANDDRSGAERTFRIDRIKSAERTGETSTPPAGFDPERYAEGPLVVLPRRSTRVVLDLQPDAAWLAEVVPHDDVRQRSKATRLTLRSVHDAWLVRLLLSVGPAVRVVEPPELAEAVRSAAAEALARYAGGSAV